uniref:Uncharacterized protein n=1 Tax=Neobodo designis TaxID=312471 RepID=A0A7S1LAC8_NEODS|mmetsp:Transcript_18194/g.56440  ORF Transcript_18194/g.56440 Transcript_18194/m.56440 type:complete len:269 (+) Transcript_18194:1-807(+)
MWAADACWSAIATLIPKQRTYRQAYAFEQLCHLDRTRGEDRCAPESPSTIPPLVGRDAAVVHEVAVTGCLTSELQGLCLHNLGATLVPQLPRDEVFERLRCELRLPEREARSVCRCHGPRALDNSNNANDTQWCRSYKVAEQRVTSVLARVQRLFAHKTQGHRFFALENAGERDGRSSGLGTFACTPGPAIFSRLCPRMWSLLDVREPAPTADSAVWPVLRTAFRREYGREVSKAARVVPGFVMPLDVGTAAPSDDPGDMPSAASARP